MKTTIQIIRTINKVASAAVTLLIIAMLFEGGNPPNLQELIAMLFFPGAVVAGFYIAWKKEMAGGLTSVGGLLCFYLYMYLQRGAFPSGPYFLLFSLPGIVFLLLSFVSKKEQQTL